MRILMVGQTSLVPATTRIAVATPPPGRVCSVPPWGRFNAVITASCGRRRAGRDRRAQALQRLPRALEIDRNASVVARWRFHATRAKGADRAIDRDAALRSL